MTAIRSKSLPLALAGMVALPVVLSASDARADGVRVRVRARASASASVRVGAPRARVYARPRVTVRTRPRVRVRPRTRLVVGGYYGFYYSSPPPSYTYYDDCYAPVYAYRPGPAQAPAPVVTRAVAPQPALPRLGLGVSASGVATNDDIEGDDVSVFGRLRIIDPLEIELEAAKTDLDDGLRVDRRLGAALYFDFAPRSTWGLYVVGGTGVIETEVNGGSFEQERVYAEGGAGLRWTLSRNFSLTGDVRWGGTAAVEQRDDDILAASRLVLPAVPDEEDYTRVRLAGILHF